MWFAKQVLLPSNRHCRSNDDCLEGKRKLSGLFCAVLCATVVHSAMHTHMNRPDSCLSVKFSFSTVILCVSVTVYLAFWDYFVL